MLYVNMGANILYIPILIYSTTLPLIDNAAMDNVFLPKVYDA